MTYFPIIRLPSQLPFLISESGKLIKSYTDDASNISPYEIKIPALWDSAIQKIGTFQLKSVES